MSKAKQVAEVVQLWINTYNEQQSPYYPIKAPFSLTANDVVLCAMAKHVTFLDEEGLTPAEQLEVIEILNKDSCNA